jgi:hypothetical protein
MCHHYESKICLFVYLFVTDVDMRTILKSLKTRKVCADMEEKVRTGVSTFVSVLSMAS